MIRDRFLKIYNQSPDAWSLRYGIEPAEALCKCGRKFKTSVPFAYEELRGLIAKVCKCGNEDTPYCFVRDPKKGDFLSI